MRCIVQWFDSNPIRAWLWLNFGGSFMLFGAQVALLIVRSGPSHCFGLHYTGLGGLLAIGASMALLCAEIDEAHALRWFSALRNVAVVGMILCHWRMGWPVFPAIAALPLADLPMLAAVTPPSRRVAQVAGVIISALASSALVLVL